MRYTKDASGREKELVLNRKELERLAQNLSKFTGLYVNMFIYIVELMYQGVLYDLTTKALDKDLDEIKIEIPFIGGLYIKYIEGEVVFDRFEFENEFKDDIKNTIENKTCKLDDIIEKKYLDKILSKYEELV